MAVVFFRLKQRPAEMSLIVLGVFVVLLAGIQLAGLVLFFGSNKGSNKAPALLSNAIQPLLILIGSLFAIRPTGYETAAAAEFVTAFLLFELSLLGACIVWIWRRRPPFWFFWATWVANLLPLAFLGYLAFFFHIF
jgi:hypothetical protein